MRANIGAKSHRGLPRDCLVVPNGLPVHYMWHGMTIANRCMGVCTNRLLTNRELACIVEPRKRYNNHKSMLRGTLQLLDRWRRI